MERGLLTAAATLTKRGIATTKYLTAFTGPCF